MAEKGGWFKKLWSDNPPKEEELPEWARWLFNPEHRKKRKQMQAAMKKRRGLTEEEYLKGGGKK
jgi:hypothetical protein